MTQAVRQASHPNHTHTKERHEFVNSFSITRFFLQYKSPTFQHQFIVSTETGTKINNHPTCSSRRELNQLRALTKKVSNCIIPRKPGLQNTRNHQLRCSNKIAPKYFQNFITLQTGSVKNVPKQAWNLPVKKICQFYPWDFPPLLISRRHAM